MTNAAQIQAAADQIGHLDILINNAGFGVYDDLSDRAALEQHLAVNLYGTIAVTQAFLPLLVRSQGAIVNVLSLASVAAVPLFRPIPSQKRRSSPCHNRCAPCWPVGV